MSLNGLVQFDKNLRKIMDSDQWKNGDFSDKANLGYRLLNSKYGLGNPINNKVKEIKHE